MKPVDPSVYRAALDRIDVYKKALKDIVALFDDDDFPDDSGELIQIVDIAEKALAAVAEADLWDGGAVDDSAFPDSQSDAKG
jgi:hypothetical protein